MKRSFCARNHFFHVHTYESQFPLNSFSQLFSALIRILNFDFRRICPFIFRKSCRQTIQSQTLLFLKNYSLSISKMPFIVLIWKSRIHLSEILMIDLVQTAELKLFQWIIFQSQSRYRFLILKRIIFKSWAQTGICYCRNSLLIQKCALHIFHIALMSFRELRHISFLFYFLFKSMLSFCLEINKFDFLQLQFDGRSLGVFCLLGVCLLIFHWKVKLRVLGLSRFVDEDLVVLEI